MKIRDALITSTIPDLCDIIIDTILSYSFHQQAINEWYRIIDRLGPFSCFIGKYPGNSISEIQKWDKYLFERCEEFEFPPKIRISFMICSAFEIPKYQTKKFGVYCDYPLGLHLVKISNELSKFSIYGQSDVIDSKTHPFAAQIMHGNEEYINPNIAATKNNKKALGELDFDGYLIETSKEYQPDEDQEEIEFNIEDSNGS